MIKLIEDDNKINMISDFVTGVIEKNKDFRAFNSAYISCAQGIDLSITLKLIITVASYKPLYSEEELEELCLKTGYYVKVESMLFSDYENEHLSNSFNYPERAMLKCGHIVYDRDGRLTKLKNEYRIDDKIDDLEWRGLVDITSFSNKILRPVGFRISETQSDISLIESCLAENIETDKIINRKEQSAPVKKLTPSQNTGNK